MHRAQLRRCSTPGLILMMTESPGRTIAGRIKRGERREQGKAVAALVRRELRRVAGRRRVFTRHSWPPAYEKLMPMKAISPTLVSNRMVMGRCFRHFDYLVLGDTGSSTSAIVGMASESSSECANHHNCCDWRSRGFYLLDKNVSGCMH